MNEKQNVRKFINKQRKLESTDVRKIDSFPHISLDSCAYGENRQINGWKYTKSEQTY